MRRCGYFVCCAIRSASNTRSNPYITICSSIILCVVVNTISHIHNIFIHSIVPPNPISCLSWQSFKFSLVWRYTRPVERRTIQAIYIISTMTYCYPFLIVVSLKKEVRRYRLTSYLWSEFFISSPSLQLFCIVVENIFCNSKVCIVYLTRLC